MYRSIPIVLVPFFSSPPDLELFYSFCFHRGFCSSRFLIYFSPETKFLCFCVKQTCSNSVSVLHPRVFFFLSFPPQTCSYVLLFCCLVLNLTLVIIDVLNITWIKMNNMMQLTLRTNENVITEIKNKDGKHDVNFAHTYGYLWSLELNVVNSGLCNSFWLFFWESQTFRNNPETKLCIEKVWRNKQFSNLVLPICMKTVIRDARKSEGSSQVRYQMFAVSSSSLPFL